jgi:glycosyltransferase involved in cell wall biosynthesis
MKVLHIYAGNLFGGIETFLIALARDSQSYSSTFSQEFALCFEGRLADELRAKAGKVHLLGNVKTSRPWTIWQARQKLKRLIALAKYDLIICHACWIQAIFGSTVKDLKVPLIFWCHDVVSGRSWIERLAKLIKPDLAIANSKYTLSSLSNLYSDAKKEILLCPVHPPKHIEDKTQVRITLNTPKDRVVIIQVSRLERLKGQSLLISALGRLADLDNWECWIVGGVQRPHEQDYLTELKIQVEKLGIGNRVQFLGQRSDVSQLLSAADIYCQPNTGSESFGITFIEALYAGLPVVTTNMGGGAEIVNDSCGRLVEPNNPEMIVETLKLLITDSQLRQKLGSGGYARATELCEPAQQLQKLEQILDQVVNIHSGLV